MRCNKRRVTKSQPNLWTFEQKLGGVFRPHSGTIHPGINGGCTLNVGILDVSSATTAVLRLGSAIAEEYDSYDACFLSYKGIERTPELVFLTSGGSMAFLPPTLPSSVNPEGLVTFNLQTTDVAVLALLGAARNPGNPEVGCEPMHMFSCPKSPVPLYTVPLSSHTAIAHTHTATSSTSRSPTLM